ncbi:glycine zipper 2TM domain-containing protein [Gimibacter soli]|uniref:17 kDa surface antigen n=1 Tax=Gimibacter soli TaxID=3024400 RepID=A0AAE9XWE2_9PROT|nr:glycine zipper 2TM domain-containing protein [Gimibacter soli]WCL54519.1 glycine zipper 2TM domain-containing protein [Gimibacter soli]
MTLQSGLARSLALSAAFVLAAPTAPAVFADPPAHAASHGKKDKGHKDKSHKGEHKNFKGGPPPWAPAHGYRRGEYKDWGYAAPIFEPRDGRCDYKAMGQILGGAVGATVGAKVSDKDSRLAAILAGTVIGVIVGGEIGKTVDKAGRGCIDHSLEYAGDGVTVRWSDGRNDFAMRPVETLWRGEQYCRRFTFDGPSGYSLSGNNLACRRSDGSWVIEGRI